ncbi:MAG: GGDEF domain-containing protein, partial [Lachnospiraceae bacterium]|nr:GGDEF domain-containing protein [Lachnospiraceae bacterium]
YLEAEQIVQIVRARLEADNKENIIKISSAVGVAVGCGKDILKVVEEADAKMYENKKLCKESRR